MKRYKTILVGIDFTAASRHALKEAVRRASLDGASIIALHVTDEFLAHEMGWFYDAHRAEMDCHALLAVLAEPLPVSGMTGLKRLLIGSVAEKVVRLAGCPGLVVREKKHERPDDAQ